MLQKKTVPPLCTTQAVTLLGDELQAMLDGPVGAVEPGQTLVFAAKDNRDPDETQSIVTSRQVAPLLCCAVLKGEVKCTFFTICFLILPNSLIRIDPYPVPGLHTGTYSAASL